MFAALTAAVLINQPQDNTLTFAEKKAGWKLLFDGKSTKGWTAWGGGPVKKGWTIENGALFVSDPENAGDIISNGKFGSFELKIDFMFEDGQNSGIMFHVADSGGAPWFSGPEIQIYDDKGAPGAQRTGWLYDLYSSEANSVKPAGEWNSFRILITPEKCQTDVNGVKYYEYKLGSGDFWARVAKSKFAEHKEFAKLGTGHIAIQGDHGKVHFKNIKIREIKGKR